MTRMEKRNYDNGKVIEIISQKVHDRTHRIILYRKWIDNASYSEISAEVNLCVRQIGYILKKYKPLLDAIVDKSL